MQFDWNEANIEHIALHGVSSDEAEQVIENNPIDAGIQIRNGERRFLQIGETFTGRVLLVVVTARKDKLRIVTARSANRKERAFYAAQKASAAESDRTDP